MGWPSLVEAIAAATYTPSRGRSNPRRIKRRTKSFLPRKGNEPLNLMYDWTPEIAK
jgi:hypothetical protein